MKQFKKQVLLALFTAACLFTLTACTAEAEKTNIDASEALMLQSSAQTVLEGFTAMPDANVEAVIEQYRENDMEPLASGLESYLGIKGDLGTYVSTGDGTSIKGEEGYTITLNTVFEKRTCQFVITLDKKMENITSMSFNPAYTLGENMTKAGLNTLMGMGTVFLVLIFISWLISCFKYISVFEKNMKNKEAAKAAPAVTAPAPAAAPVLAAAPAPAVETPADDSELIAVITAAIVAASAAAGTPVSADGLVVRSIKRVPNRKWK